MYLILIVGFLPPLIHCLSFQRLSYFYYLWLSLCHTFWLSWILSSKEVLSVVYWFFYYFISIIMEATEFLYWIITIYLFKINANNLMISVFQALFITTFYVFKRLFFYLLKTKRAYYIIQFIMYYFITIHYYMISYRYFFMHHSWPL